MFVEFENADQFYALSMLISLATTRFTVNSCVLFLVFLVPYCLAYIPLPTRTPFGYGKKIIFSSIRLQ